MATKVKTEGIQLSGKSLHPYVKALQNASGITEDHARICVLYALCTHRKDLTKMPILVIIGMTGTGKSTLLDQMSWFVKRQKKAIASTYASMRQEMAECRTYLIDEGDNVDETLLQYRTNKENSEITFMAPTHGKG